jgi:hypothetical protein
MSARAPASVFANLASSSTAPTSSCGFRFGVLVGVVACVVDVLVVCPPVDVCASVVVPSVVEVVVPVCVTVGGEGVSGALLLCPPQPLRTSTARARRAGFRITWTLCSNASSCPE